MKKIIQNFINNDSEDILFGMKKLPKKILFLSGSFNPFHFGHNSLLKAAEKICNRTGILELSIINVDKPQLTIDIIQQRLEKIPIGYPILLTKKATFIEKAESYPGAYFVLGYDTAIRLFDIKYHKDINFILSRFLELESNFIIAGRVYKNKFLTLRDINIPEKFQKLFTEIPEKFFREDISSSQIRLLD